MRRIFLRLTRLDDSALPGEHRRDTRRRVTTGNLIPANRDPKPIHQLIQRLADARLLVTSINANTGQEELEVAHEALIRYWPTLQHWLDESRANLRVSEGVRQAAQAWNEGQKHQDLLQHRGSQLEQATALLASPYFAVNQLEAQYIKACEAWQTRLIEEKEQQRHREIQYFRRMAMLSITGLIIALMLSAGVFYSRQTAIENNRKAVIAEEKANHASQLSRARELATKADAMMGAPQPSLLLAIKSLQTAPPGDIIASAEESLWKTLNQAGGIALTGHQAAINAVAVSHNGACAITADDKGVIGVWSLAEISKLLPTTTASSFTQADLPPPQFIYSQQGSILSAVINSEASWFITGGLDGSLWLWDLGPKQNKSSWEMLPSQISHYPLGQPLKGPIYSLELSPDKCWLATASGDKTAQLWSLCSTPNHPITQAKELAEWLNQPTTPHTILKEHTEEVLDVAFSPDQHWLATGSRDNTTRIWDLSQILTSPMTQTLASQVVLEEETMIFAVEFSPQGDKLVTAGGTPPWVSNNTHDGHIYIRSTSFLKKSPGDDSKLLSARDSGYVSDQAGQDHITDLLMTTDNQLLIASNWDGSIFIWRVQNMYIPRREFFGPEGNITHMALWGNDGFLTVGSDNNLRIWNLRHPNAAPVIFSAHLAWVNNVALSNDNQWVVTGSEDGFVRLWNLNHFNAVPLQLDNHQASVHALALSSDNHWLASGGDDKAIQLWQFPPQPLVTTTATLSNVTRLDEAYTLGQPMMLMDNQASIRNLLISGDNHWLVSNSADGVVRRWDLHKPQAGGVKLPSTGQEVLVMAVNQQGNLLVTGHKGGTAYVWDLNNPVAPKYVLSGHSDDVSAIAISSSGRWVATGSEDSTMQLWDMSHLDNDILPTQVFTYHTDGILTIVISNDEHWLVTGGWDGHVGVIDLTNLQTPPRIFRDHVGWVNVLAISPDNRWLISGSYDQTINVWDLNSNQDRPVTLSSHEGRITSLAVSADGNLFISGSSDRTARLWLLNRDELIKQACHTAGRELRENEKLLFLGAEEAARPICK
jgi:WD40 repeat protein